MASLTALMDLMKDNSANLSQLEKHTVFDNSLFTKIVEKCLKIDSSENNTCLLLTEFYIEKYDDIRYYFLKDSMYFVF